MLQTVLIAATATLVLTVVALISKRARPYAIAGVVAAFAVTAWLELGPAAQGEPTRESTPRPAPHVDVTITSDPSGASVKVNGSQRGLTPVTFSAPMGAPLEYRVEADEPFDDYDLYVPYRGTVTPTEDVAIDVWLERTSAEQQAEQRTSRAEARAQAERAALQRQLNASRWRLSRSTDPITDVDNSAILTYATEYPSVLERNANLVIRCDRNDPTSSDGIVIYIDADTYLGSRDLPIDWRFDDNPSVQKQQWRTSTDGVALFNLSYKTAFVRQMLDANTLSARLYDYRSVGHYYEFDVTGARAALTLLGCYRGSAL